LKKEYSASSPLEIVEIGGQPLKKEYSSSSPFICSRKYLSDSNRFDTVAAILATAE
jgi:hypothetical protein